MILTNNKITKSKQNWCVKIISLMTNISLRGIPDHSQTKPNVTTLVEDQSCRVIYQIFNYFYTFTINSND